MNIPEFLNQNDAITVHKENGTDVSYFIFPEYEIHLNKIAPKSIQEWHFHSQLEETLLINKGELTCRWIENGTEKSKRVGPNGVIRVCNSAHTFENETEEDAEFTVFRFVPDGVDKREIIKRDKVIITR